MINKIISGLYDFIFTFVGGFTQPISDFITQNIPNLDSYLQQVNDFMNSITGVIGWFVYLIPKPFTATMLAVLFYFVASSGTVILMVYIGGHVLDLIKRLNIFGSK